MSKRKISIACQGGGSQTAFTAGALKALLEAGVTEEFDLVSITGTSGGAVCAALVWFALERNETPAWQRLMAFWQDNTAQTTAENVFNTFVVEALRLVNRGVFPIFQVSPSSALTQLGTGMGTMYHRENFRDFGALLRTHLDFDEIRSWGPRAKPPILVVGAANVTTGKLTRFVSRQQPIRAEHILASCAVPNIFPAVDIDGDAYWDGLFSDNPPVQELTRPSIVGVENIPDEIWVIKINPTICEQVPIHPDEIVNRRNELDGNISLFHQLEHLATLNDLLLADAYRPEFLAKIDIQAPIRIPKCFATDPDRPYHIPMIEMDFALARTLDYESKIDRSPANISLLIAAGEASARQFLIDRQRRPEIS